MEQEIRFCTSADGTRIAYATYGELPGTPLVGIAAWSRVLEAFWAHPLARRYAEVSAQHRLFVEYDRRGIGASQREVSDLSLDAQISDLSAVVDTAGLERFDLIGWFDGAAIAVSYAAKHPARVSRLVLCNPILITTAGTSLGAGVANLARMIRTDWSLARRALATVSYGTEDMQRWYSRTLRDSMSQEVAARYHEEFMSGLDLTAQLPQVHAPTLVIHFHEGGVIPAETCRQAATSIPDARFVSLRREDWFEDIVLPFLDEGREEQRPELHTGTAVILFADIAGSTALTERLGDDTFRAKARELDSVLRTVIRENGGTPVEGKLLGDGVLAVFTSARQAIEAALRSGIAGNDATLPLHLGLHAGDVTREEDPDGRGNVYGGAVNIAARISALAAPGEVLVSQTVRDLARTSAGVSFEERGERELKGVSEPVRVWRVATREEA